MGMNDTMTRPLKARVMASLMFQKLSYFFNQRSNQLK